MTHDVSEEISGLTDGRHARAEEASLALHRAVAEHLQADPAVLERARARVARWLREGSVEGSIGEPSPFHETFGCYAQGVGERTAVLPEGWTTRLVAVPTASGTGLCLEPHDLVISKYVAGREKDRDYVRTVARHGLADRETLLARLEVTPVDGARRATLRAQISTDFS